LRIATAMSGNPLSAEVVHAVLTDGGYRRHIEGVRTRLARARARTMARLRDIGITPWLEPAAGLFVWARLPAGSMPPDWPARRWPKGSCWHRAMCSA
jgi:DNA-binding transcriptional MocR family regulator